MAGDGGYKMGHNLKYKYRLGELFADKFKSNKEKRVGKRMLARALNIEVGTLEKYIYARKNSNKELSLDKGVIIMQFFELDSIDKLYYEPPSLHMIIDRGTLKAGSSFGIQLARAE